MGAGADAAWLQGLVNTLNPQNQPGRLTLIHRFGVKELAAALQKAIEAVRQTGQTVLWVCDPMHGNTSEAPNGRKTRHVEDILAEVTGFFEVHRSLGTHPGGIHIEFTGDDVDEGEMLGYLHELENVAVRALDVRRNIVLL